MNTDPLRARLTALVAEMKLYERDAAMIATCPRCFALLRCVQPLARAAPWRCAGCGVSFYVSGAERCCGDPAPDQSPRSCDLPQGHDGDHWTDEGRTLKWPQDTAARAAAPSEEPDV